MTRRDFRAIALGMFVANGLVCPLILGWTFTRGFVTGAIAAVLMLAISSFYKK